MKKLHGFAALVGVAISVATVFAADFNDEVSSKLEDPFWVTESVGTPASPPREYFSLNTLYLDEHTVIHVGHDLINQNYVVFPSPNVQNIETLSDGKKRVTLQQYFPNLETRITRSYNINPEKLHYLYVTSYQIFDQSGKLIEELKIPPGVEYRPPNTYQLVVEPNVKLLSFVFGFTGRTGWADSGISTDLQGMYKELRELDVDGNASIHLEVNPSAGLKTFEVLTSKEDTRISKILSSLHFIVAWGKMAEREDLISQIASLKKSEEISIDLAKGVEDLRKYPLVFGDPLDPKWHSVIKKISSEKLTEKEFKNDKSGSASLGLGKFFNFNGSASSKRESRFKEIVKFDLEGEFYVPKTLNFHIRSNHTFSMINELVFQAYSKFEEAEYKIGAGVALNEAPPRRFEQPVSVSSNAWSPESAEGAAIDFKCPEGSVLGGFNSRIVGNKMNRAFQFECRQLKSLGNPLVQGNCEAPSPASKPTAPVSYSCAADSFLVGEKTWQAPNVHDRLHVFSCCNLNGADDFGKTISLKKKACQWSPWLNNYATPVSYSCPSGTVAAGIRSEALAHVIASASPIAERLGIFGHHRRPPPPPVFDRRYQVECCTVGF